MKFKLPKGEVLWVTYYKKDKPAYIITSTPMRDSYFLYDVTGDKPKKLAKSQSPKVFEEKYNLRGE